LPKNHTEGDIPRIAISTGGADTLECLLGRIGLDPNEYTPGANGEGHIHIFQGQGIKNLTSAPNTAPAAPPSSMALWDTAAHIMQYDAVLLSCEGQATDNMNQQVLFDYAAAGGRVFASHFHFAWFTSGPFGSANVATWVTSDDTAQAINANIVTTLPTGQPFPKGHALQQWLMKINGLTNGELHIEDARHNANVSASNTASQAWIVADSNAPFSGAAEYFTFDTPLTATPDKQCGRVVFSDLHVGAASGDYQKGTPSSPSVAGTRTSLPKRKCSNSCSSICRRAWCPTRNHPNLRP
jgi:hypothetical protein